MSGVVSFRKEACGAKLALHLNCLYSRVPVIIGYP